MRIVGIEKKGTKKEYKTTRILVACCCVSKDKFHNERVLRGGERRRGMTVDDRR